VGTRSASLIRYSRRRQGILPARWHSRSASSPPDGRWRWDGERWVSVETGAPDTWLDQVARTITDLRVARPAGWPALVLAAVSGTLADLALRSSRVGVAASLLLVALCAAS
jgi:hypothetical protein